MKNEIWKQIEDYPKYEVSNLGHVRKSACWCIYDSGYREHQEAVPIAPIPEDDGSIYVNFEYKHWAVHLLVAHAFLSDPGVPSFVKFLDGDVSNCAASNLAYISVSEFSKRRIADGFRNAPKPYTGKQVVCTETGEVYSSIKVLCEALDLKRYIVTPKIISGEPINGKHYKFGSGV